MKYFGLIVLVLMFFLTESCKNQYLRGYFTRKEFISQSKWKHNVAENYKPNLIYLDSIQKVDSFDVKLFLGTWCSDSRKWVPRFFAIQNQMPIKSLQIISVDTTKKDSLGLMKMNKVDSLPTFIFIRNQKEIGRIIEKPYKKKLEKDIYTKLKGRKN